MTHPSSNWKSVRIVLFIVIFLCIYVNVGAEVICDKGESPTIRGRIEKGDFSKLLVCLQDFIKKGMPVPTSQGGHTFKEVGWVCFNSQGGDVNEAIKIGRFLRESLAEVVVNEQCSSACFLAIVGAIKVYAGEPFGKVGIHRVFYDAATLKQTNINDYESLYNELKKGARQYCYDMDVPTPIVEKMFSVPSEDIYILTNREIKQLSKHPAYDEWINAKCPHRLSGKEQEDYSTYVSSGFRKGGYSESHIEYLKSKNSAYEQCVDAVRWEQFKKTVAKYSR